MKYKKAGVNIQESAKVLKRIKALAKTTHNKNVLAGVGPFAALYDLGDGRVLVSSADGAGTKIEIARAKGQLQVIGIDIVNHCVNDILCSGAKPLFFLDYIAQDRLRPEEIIQIMGGMVLACREGEFPLIGGELAQMPGIYIEGKSDVAGTIVGIVGKNQIIDGSKIKPGDMILGLHSLGPHTNGYSLIRKIGLLDDALLEPHKSYLEPVYLLFRNGHHTHIHGIAHITGGGLRSNIIRILPKGCQARIHLGSWPVLPIFGHIQREGNVSAKEMYQVFNMGIGMALIVPQETVADIHQLLWNNGEPCYVIGEITSGEKPTVHTQGVKFYKGSC